MSASWVRERGSLSRLRHEDIVSRSCPVQFRKSLRNNKSANPSRAVRSTPADSNYPAGYVRRNIYIVRRGVTRDLHVPQKSLPAYLYRGVSLVFSGSAIPAAVSQYLTLRSLGGVVVLSL